MAFLSNSSVRKLEQSECDEVSLSENYRSMSRRNSIQALQVLTTEV